MTPGIEHRALRADLRRTRPVSRICSLRALGLLLAGALGLAAAVSARADGVRDPNDPPPPPPPNIVKVGYKFDTPVFPGPADPNEIPPQVKPPEGQKVGPLIHNWDPNDPNDGEWGVFGPNKQADLWFLVNNTDDKGQKKKITISADIRTNDRARNQPGAAGEGVLPSGSMRKPPPHQPVGAPTVTPADPNDPNGPQTWTWVIEIKPQPKKEKIRITLKTGSHADDFIAIDNVKITTECTPKDKPPQKPNAPPQQKDKSQSHYEHFRVPQWPPESDYSVLPSWYEETLWTLGGSFPPMWLPGVTDHQGVWGLPGGVAAEGFLSVRRDDQPEPQGVEYCAYQFDFYTGDGMLMWEPIMPPECEVVNYLVEVEELENGWQRAYLTFDVVPPPAWQQLSWYMSTAAGRSEPVAIDNVVMSGSTWWTDFWYDGFDIYDVGDGLHGVYGWKGWDNDPTLDGLVTDVEAGSAFQALEVADGTDLVQPLSDFDWGRFAFTAWQYVPSDFQSGCDPSDNCGSYFILLNTYNDGGPYHWSVQLHADSLTQSFIRDGPSPTAAPLVTGRWARIEVLIDLNADLYRVYYDGVQLGSAASWTAGVFGGGGGALNIGALDLYANGSSPVYYDDVHLRLLEPGDLNGDGVVNFGDINPFVLILTNPATWQTAYPHCPRLNGDINGDGNVDFGDINPFVALLVGG